MNKITAIILSFIFITLYSQAQQVYEHQFIVKEGDKAPNFEVELTNGSVFKLSEQIGKVVMLQFTASWCSVCRKEMPLYRKRYLAKNKA